MKVKIQVIVESKNDEAPIVEELAELSRDDLTPETLGLTLDEAKNLLANLQSTMVTQQVDQYVEKQRRCTHCGKSRPRKGHHQIVYRTLFGKMKLQSPRLYTCACQQEKRQSESPIASLLPERTAPELLYLQTKWASLMSYGLTIDRLSDVLPIETNVATVYRNLHKVAQRTDNELEEERHIYIDGCPRDWGNLPRPDAPITVGIDGCYVHAREGENRKAGWFEVIVGKSITGEGDKKLERIKWYLWHGNVFMALDVLDDLTMDIEVLSGKKSVIRKLENTVSELNTYIVQNQSFIPNYRDRYFYGEAISTGFVESTVNQVVSKRMVKKQQMRWTKRGAHNLLQVRTQVINDDLRDTFCRWYPNMTPSEETEELAA